MALIKYKVGIGGHYVDWNDAWNALQAIGSFTNDYQLEQISDITVTTVPTAWPAGQGYHLNGRTLEIICKYANSHQGDPTRGFKTYVNASPDLSTFVFTSSIGGTVIIDGLYVIHNAIAGAGTTALALPTDRNGTNFNYHKTIARNLLVKGCMQNQPWETGITIPNNRNSAKIPEIYNCKIWNCGSSGIFLVTGNNDGGLKIENCTVYNCGYYSSAGIHTWAGIDGSLNPVINTYFRNVISINDNVTWPCWHLQNPAASTTVNNCASSDNSCPTTLGTNNIINLVFTPEFESLLETNPEYLFLNNGYMSGIGLANPEKGQAPLRVGFSENVQYGFPAGMVLPSGGLQPTVTIDDIAGITYGKYGYYPIGCHNAEIA